MTFVPAKSFNDDMYKINGIQAITLTQTAHNEALISNHGAFIRRTIKTYGAKVPVKMLLLNILTSTKNYNSPNMGIMSFLFCIGMV